MSPRRPPKWRLALVTWAMLAVVVTVVIETAGPVLDLLPTPVDTMALTGVVVVMMTWLVMPVATRRFARFLCPAAG